MAQFDQKQHMPSDSYILFDIEPLRNLERNCLDDVIASIAKWLGRNHELMYNDAWNFTFFPEVSGQSDDISARLQVKDRLDKEALERFHGLKSIEHVHDSPLEALSLIQQTLEAGAPVVLGINSYWVPWDDGYQQRERRHSCIVVGMNPHTQDLYCTDPYFKQKGTLLPRADFLKGYLFCETFSIVADECNDLLTIVDTILERLRHEISGNRPFIQMRDLANALLTSFQALQKADTSIDSLEVPLFVQLTNVADSRTKSSQMFTYLGNTYDTRFLAYAERLQKVSSQWRIASAMFMKMHLTSRWTEAALQKIALRILTISVEEQALAYELLAFLESFKQHKKTETESGGAFAFENDWETLEGHEYLAPQTAVEAEIAEAWQEALAVERVGMRDNFFELGGQSLKAASLLSRLGQQLKLHIPISALFQYPTVQELAQYVTDQQAELARKQKAPSPSATRQEDTGFDPVTPDHLPTPILPRSSAQHQESCPTSFAQQRLWLLDQLHAHPSPYYLLNALRLEGTLNVAVLQRSLNEIVRRHEVLRTTFFQHEETVFQRISPTASLPIPQVDLRHLAPQEQETEIRLLVQRESQAPFDLQRGPLLRARLLHVGEQQHILLLAFHHIVTDGWSLNVFTRELVALYQAFCAEQPASLPELSIQYADYALWQRQQLQGEALEQQVEYWKRQLSGIAGALQLPHDYPRPPIQTFRGAAQQGQISPPLTQALTHLSQKEGVTLFMTLLAAFQVLLYRYSGQSDITVGTSVANRTHPETEHLIGFFVNTLALRTDLSGNPSVQEVLKRVKTMALGAYEHQELPFEQVVEALQPERTMSHSPLFQVFFVLQNTPELSFALPGLRVANLDVEQQTAEFDLVMIVEETSAGLQIILEYKTDLFKAETIARMLRHYQQQLNAMQAHPTTGIADLPLLTEEEKRQILLDFNAVDRPRPTSCLHTLLAEQAARTPHAVAVRYEQDELQYQELERRANQLAHYLQRLGVGPESRVGIALERSLELVVALLGILKAGGAYVPLDPGYPAERLAFIAQDAEIELLLTQKAIRTHLPPLFCQQVIELNQEWPMIAREPSHAPVSTVTPENVAYIIYTSGSTGRPKGAMNTHAAITHRLLWMQDTYQLNMQDRVLQKTPYSFDVSVWEFFWPLLTGASLILAKPDGQKDGRYLIDLIVSEKITTLHFVPSLLSAMLEEPGFFACTSLKRVFCSGEALAQETQKRFLKGMHAELHNLYGPTEAAVDVSFWQCQAQEPGHIVPIGRPINNVQLYILDQRGNPVPIGVVGELFIGGIALARGYVGAPDLTAEKFLPHPFSSVPGARLYRTGDLARYRADGVIEFLGRIDHQVKIRGFRIEPGEIETILAEHPAVQESIVLARRYAADDTRLAAYIVPDSRFAAPLRKLLRFSQEGRLTGLQQRQFPNGMTVICKNKAEVAFVQHELLGEQGPLRHGITLRPGDCVFDVGANIGLFTLWVHQQCPEVQIYAFEPVPPIFQILRLNTELYNLDVRLFACGLADDATQTHATLTYYPHNSLLSGRFANLQEDQAVVKTYLRNQDIAEQTDMVLSNTELDELLQEQLVSEEYACEMSTLSSIMQREHIQRIDLLKIDVEKSEMDVLRGIQEEDWNKIQQIIVEVHDSDGRLHAITQLLQEHGFVVQSTEDVLLKHTGLFTLYARRQNRTFQTDERQTEHPSLAEYDPRGMSSETLIADIQRFLKQKLPDYMVPSSIHLLDTFPRLPNGKIDHTALLALASHDEHKERASRPPQTPAEQAVAAIWEVTLKRQHIGQEDNFFELGGHSLLAMRVISTLSRVFQVQLPLHEFFAHPTLAALAACIERMRQGKTATSYPKIQPVSREQPLPLSFAQQRLWLLDQLTPENAFYNLSFALQLMGKLEQGALERSFSCIVQRHEVLRTTFTWHNEEAVLSIRSSTAIEIPVIDLSGMDEARSRNISREVMLQGAERPFNLTTGPLLRLHLLRITPEEHILLICVHHSIADGWSMDIFVREFTAFYRHFTEGLPLSLPALPVQYADFAVWQRQWLSGEVLAKQQSYWRKQLAGAPPLLELPTDYPRPSIQTFSGTSLARGLPTELASELFTLSQREGVTLFMLLLAAFQTLLYRYCGQPDIVVGTPIASRFYEEVEDLIGFFVNTLVLRSDLSGNPSFRSLLARVRRVCLDAYAHQDIPFEHLVEILQVQRTLSHNPLFQVMFTLQNSGAASLRLPGLTIEPLIFDDHVAKFDLSLTVVEDGQALTIEANYNSDLFSEQTIRNLLEHYQMLLQGVVANPSQTVDALPLLTQREHDQILHEWNSKQDEHTPERCFYEIFQEQALRKPDAVALVFGEERFTYHELNRRANQLAHYLLSLGVEPESRVILFTDRSPDAILGILAIWKAGGIYVPIDPSYPAERVAFLFQDAEATALITRQDLLHLLPEHHLHVVNMDTQRAILAQQSTENPSSRATLQNGAYMIYTSGSTGKPKAVLVEQGSLINVLQTSQQTFAVRPDDRVPCFASFSFDLSLLELFLPLLIGGIALLFTREQLLDLDTLVANLDRMTIIHMVPSLMREVVRRLKENKPAQQRGEHIRMIFVGGEAVPPDLLMDLHDLFHSARVYVLYGPTETTIICSSYLAPRGKAIEHHPIGSSFPGMTLTIRDQHQQLVPAGVPGEIYIGGPGVARGYFKREELTSKAFLVLDHERCYKTGDLARYRHDGTIEYLGRIDTQVKLRGYRIELEEIEQVLHQCPEVEAATVMVREDGSGEKNLVAYIVRSKKSSDGEDGPGTTNELELRPSSGEYQAYDELIHYSLTNDERRNSTYKKAMQRLVKDGNLPITFTDESKHLRSGYRETAFYQALFSDEDVPMRHEMADAPFSNNLRARLSQVLPDYMVPSAFVLLDALPLSPNGKINRHALPAPEHVRSHVENTLVAPRTPAEHQLARIWADLLGLEQVSITDDFFASGGHSLLAVRLVNHIREQFGQSIPLATLFQGKTIEHLATLLEKPLPTQNTFPLVELQHGTARLPFFCIHPVGGNVFCYVELARALGDDLPFYALQAEGLEAGSTPLTSIEDMAAHYIKAMMSIQPRGPYLLGGWSMGGLIALEMARQLQDQQLEVGLVTLIDSWAANPLSASGHQPADMDSMHFIRNFVLDLFGPLEQTSEEWFAGLQNLGTEEEQLLFIAERAKQLRILPSDVDHLQTARLLSVFKANIRATQAYLPQDCTQPLLLFSAEEELKGEERADRRDLYELASGERERHIIPGNHYTILTQPQVQLIAKRLRARLDTFQQRIP
jgi:amino acid adenylation domain-containing protein/FkbM family methyltransferase